MKLMNRIGLLVVAVGMIAFTAGARDTASSFKVLIENHASGVRFSLPEEDVTAVRLEIFSLGGQPIFQSTWQTDKTIIWPMAFSANRIAANGVYLYTITTRDHHGQEHKKLGKLALLSDASIGLNLPSIGELSDTEPSAALFPLPTGTLWRQRLGADKSDTLRLQRKSTRQAGGPITNFETLLQLEADGKLRLKELCLGASFAPVTAQNPDNLNSEGECRTAWGTTGGGGGTPNGWADDGLTVRLSSVADKVGIGTNNPTEKLTVAGNIDATGPMSKISFNYATLNDLPSASTYHGMLAHVHATGKAYFAHNGQWIELALAGGGVSPNGWTDEGGIVRLLEPTDKVGIGTNNPTEKLTVAGNIDATGSMSKISFNYPTLNDLPSATTYHGMLAHVHATGKAYFAHAGQWIALAHEGSGGGVPSWSLTGNVGINPSTQFIGTTTNVALAFRTNDIERMRITEVGTVKIGSGPICQGVKLDVTSLFTDRNCYDAAILGEHIGDIGILGRSSASGRGTGVMGIGEFMGVRGESNQGNGVLGESKNSQGVVGRSESQGESGVGVAGYSDSELGAGVLGFNGQQGVGVRGESLKNFGVFGKGEEKGGVFGFSIDGAGVAGLSTKKYGLAGGSINSTGVYGESQGGTYLFEGVDGNSNNRRFAVERATGNVKADGAFTGGGVDYADMLPVVGKASDYEPGDVLVIGSDGKLRKSNEPYSTALAGAYSTKPAFVGDPRGLVEDKTHTDNNLVPVALVGLVPVKVSAENGAIKPGDLLTTSSIPGYAMKATPLTINEMTIYPTGAILGKAMQSLEKGTGVINVLVTLR